MTAVDLDLSEPEREMTEDAAHMFAMTASCDEKAFIHVEERFRPAGYVGVLHAEV